MSRRLPEARRVLLLPRVAVCAAATVLLVVVSLAVGWPWQSAAHADDQASVGSPPSDGDRRTSEAATADPGAAFRGKIIPFIQKYCSDCHGPDEPEGGIALTEFKDVGSFLTARKAWRLTGAKLHAGEMPPIDHDVRPKPEESAAIAEWIEAELARTVCTGPVNPGRVTIRRLNRAEYNSTIRDLVGIDFKPAEDFPNDDVGYGFDNIGDVLSMPSLLLEKYLAAAETIVEKAILVDDPDKAPAQRVLAARLEGAGSTAEEDSRVFTSEGEASIRLDVPREGEFLLTVRAGGEQAGQEAIKMSVRLDDKEVKQFEVANQKFNPIDYKTKLHVGRGAARISVAFLNDYNKTKEQVEKGERPGDRNLHVQYIELQGPLGLDPDTLPESHKRIMICTPAPERPVIIRPRRRRPMTDEERAAARKARDDARRQAEEERTTRTASRAECARTIIANFAERAFRRPVTNEEVERLMAFWHACEKDNQPFERGIQVALSAVLVSPHFLYRIEGEPAADSPDNIYALNDFELATRMSYFLWSTMPDEELYQVAKRGELRKDGNLEAQVRRMLRDPKARALVDNFGGQWLQTRRLSAMTPDKKLFPTFDESLRDAMQQETDLFFAAVMREDRSLLEFIDADYTFLNERLARHYGIDGVKGDEFRKVELTGDQPAMRHRGGVLTMASVLLLTSNPTRTSPVKRGKYVMENLLGTPPPPPPPDVPELAEGGAELVGTLKQRMEQHRENAACAVCHTRMDAIGFGLENFDAIGAWRDKDGPHAIDAAGELAAGRSFNGPSELKKLLAARPGLFVRCLTDRMLTYALGRGLEEYDECTIERIAQAVAKNDYKFSSLAIEIVKSDAFQKKRGAK
jgi:mono/diheme cytochrome c family protein